MFENVTWPVACVYNTTTEGGSKIDGKAEIEVIKGPVNKLIKRRDDRLKQVLVDYASEAKDRVSNAT
jgi:hypothetical protein